MNEHFTFTFNAFHQGICGICVFVRITFQSGHFPTDELRAKQNPPKIDAGCGFLRHDFPQFSKTAEFGETFYFQNTNWSKKLMLFGD